MKKSPKIIDFAQRLATTWFRDILNTTTSTTTTVANACNVNAAGSGAATSLFVREKYGDLSEDEDAAGSYVASGRQRMSAFQKVSELLS